MAFVDMHKNKLILKVVLAGPPAVGKTERLIHIGENGGRTQKFGSTVIGPQQMAILPLASEAEGRDIEIEVYEWHGPEKADLRMKGLFVGIDGLIYMVDAREDRMVDSVNTFKFVLQTAGKSKIQRLPALLVLGQMDEGLLRLSSFDGKLEGPTWSDKLELSLEEGAEFVEALRVYGEVMLARVL